MDPSPPPASETGNLTLEVKSSQPVSECERFRRFLCYGSESSTYSTRDRPRLGLERVPSLSEMLEAGRGSEAVQEVRRLIRSGGERIPGPVLFSLAVISQHSDDEAKRAAYGALAEVCMSPRELFSFVQHKKELRVGAQRGMWGRALRKFVADWYNVREPLRLAREVTACKRKGGWTHQDLFRLAHFKPANDAVAMISKYITKGWKEVQVEEEELTVEVRNVWALLEAVEKVKHASDEQEVAHLIEKHGLHRGHLLNKHLKSKEVWRALVKRMPLSSLLTHLGQMSTDKFLTAGSPDVPTVCERIRDGEDLLTTRTHPLAITLASESYRRGHGIRGKTKWEPNRDVMEALETAFCKCLSNVEATGKRMVVGVDVSSHLGSVALGSCVSTVAIAASMSMVLARREPNTQFLVFSEGAVVPRDISADSSLSEITTKLIQACSGGTDCALPVTWAAERDRTVDVFLILTNNETWTMTSNLAETLRAYRRKAGVFSKLVVCAMTTSVVCVADPDDRGMLDVCGFDLYAVDVIRNFIADVI